MTRRLGVLFIGALFAAAVVMAAGAPAYGQMPTLAQTEPKPAGEAKPEEKKEEEKPKTFWDENTLFGYIENSLVWNTGRASRGNHNELRYYDFQGSYTFNMGEFSIKKDPSERYPFGYGLVLTAGIPGTSNDSQKNHALGHVPRPGRPVRVPEHGELRRAGGVRVVSDPDRERPDPEGREVRDLARLRGHRGAERPELLAVVPVHVLGAADPRRSLAVLPAAVVVLDHLRHGRRLGRCRGQQQHDVVHGAVRLHADQGPHGELQLDHRRRAEPQQPQIRGRCSTSWSTTRVSRTSRSG